MDTFKSRFFQVVTLIFILPIFHSCQKEGPMFMNSDADLQRIQSKIEKLSKGNQVDSVSVRSTLKKSLVSSIFLLMTDENDGLDVKKSIEVIPAHDLLLEEKSKIKKDALHSFKPDIAKFSKLIEDAKKLLPEGVSYKDVENLRYAASPFGEKYYIGLEVDVAKDFVSNEYVSVFYDSADAMYHENVMEQSNKMPTIYYLVSFIVEDNQLKILTATEK